MGRRSTRSGKRDQTKGTRLHRLGGAAPSRRYPAHAMLFFCAYGKLWACVLATDSFQAPFGSERLEGDAARLTALSRRLLGATSKRLAFRPYRRAPLACSRSAFTQRLCVGADGPLRLRSFAVGRFLYIGRRILFRVSPGILGAPEHVPGRIRGRRIHWPDQFGGKSR